MVTHDLNTWRKYFRRIMDGSKPFEIRLNDRDFQVGDRLRLIEIEDEEPHARTGNELMVDVTYLCDYAQQEDFVVMGIRFSSGDQSDYNPSRRGTTEPEVS